MADFAAMLKLYGATFENPANMYLTLKMSGGNVNPVDSDIEFPISDEPSKDIR